MSEIENITDNDLDTAEFIDLEDENGDTVTFELSDASRLTVAHTVPLFPKKTMRTPTATFTLSSRK